MLAMYNVYFLNYFFLTFPLPSPLLHTIVVFSRAARHRILGSLFINGALRSSNSLDAASAAHPKKTFEKYLSQKKIA
jgi:hypothetical protein